MPETKISLFSSIAIGYKMGGGRKTLWEEAGVFDDMGVEFEIVARPSVSSEIPSDYLLSKTVGDRVVVPVISSLDDRKSQRIEALRCYLESTEAVPVVHGPWQEVFEALRDLGRKWIYMPHLFEEEKESGYGRFSFGESSIVGLPRSVWSDLPDDLFHLNLPRRQIEKEMVFGATVVVLPTETECQKTMDLFPDQDPRKFHVIYPGVDHKRFNGSVTEEENTRKKRGELGIPHEAFVFGMVNRSDPIKNVEGVIRAFAEIFVNQGDSSQTLMLAIFGIDFQRDKRGNISNSYTRQIIDIIDSLEAEFIEKGFTGFKNGVMLSPFIPAERAFAAIGKNGVYINYSRHETASLSTLEAMVSGVACIVRGEQYGGAYELTAGKQLTANDDSELLEQMRNVMSSENLRQQLAENGLTRGADFSWEKHCQELLALTVALSEGDVPAYIVGRERSLEVIHSDFLAYLESAREVVLEKIRMTNPYRLGLMQKREDEEEIKVNISRHPIVNQIIAEALTSEIIGWVEDSFIEVIDNRIDKLDLLKSCLDEGDYPPIIDFIKEDLWAVEMSLGSTYSQIATTLHLLHFFGLIIDDCQGEARSHMEALVERSQNDVVRFQADILRLTGWLKKLRRVRREFIHVVEFPAGSEAIALTDLNQV